MLHARARRLLALTLTTAAALTFAVRPAAAQPVPNDEHERIAARVASAGSARVIVGLELATQPEGRLTRNARDLQRAEIRAAQNAAVGQLLAGTAGRAHALFDSVPHFAAEVDQAALARIRSSRLVRSLQEDVPVRPGLAQSTVLVNANGAWAAGRTGAGWAVAVLDTGVDKTHPFLAGKVVSEACYSSNTSQSATVCPGGVTASTDAGSGVNCNPAIDGCTHGTHVAGIVAGTGAPDGSHGVARGAGIIAVQVFSHFPAQGAVMSYTSDQIRGLERVLALKDTFQIAAVNMSLGGGMYNAPCDASQGAIKAAIDNLRSVGIATVIASGNDGYRVTISAPACVSSAVSVGAVCDAGPDGSACGTGVGGVASYSNIASFLSLVAPGSYIASSVPGGGYAAWNGTSMAAPHVAGAWALVKQAQPGISVDDALSLLRTNAVTVNDTRSSGVVTGLKRIELSFLAGTAYTLTVGRAGAGSGNVVSAPVGISCGADCSEPYAAGTTVTLNPQPAAGSQFGGWSGDCSGAGTCTVTMAGARSVTASFVPASYTLSVTRSGAGSGSVASSPEGIACGSTCSAGYTGGNVTLTATAAEGSTFAGWSGACSGTGGCTVAMSQARSVGASFTLNNLAVTVAKAGNGAGTVTSSPTGIACGSTCSASRPYGSTLTLTATPAAGSLFGGWSGACSGSDACTLAMTEARSATATFIRAPQTLTVRRGGTGTGTVGAAEAGIACGDACTATLPFDTVVELGATPAEGSTFAGWSGACTGTGACVVTLSQARTVTATFTRILLRLAVSKDGGGAGTVSSDPQGIACGSTCAKAIPSGTTVTLTATPAAGSVFTGWGGACSGDASCVVTMSEAANVSATFHRSQYRLAVARRGTGKGVVGAEGTELNCGAVCSTLLPLASEVALVPAAAPESAFTGWGGACSGDGACVVSMWGARTVTATFTRTHYTLTVGVRGTGAGTIVAPDVLACGEASCAASLPIGTVVNLGAVPAEGSTFTGWGGACSGTGACSVTLASARNVTANFTRITYKLAVTRSGSGSVTSEPAGIACGSACAKAYGSGTVVTLVATPASGYVFAGWTGACAGTDACVVTLDAALGVGALFTRP